jgi:cysteine desulfurase
MTRIYLDNAATTMMDEDVLQAMLPYMTSKFGNPSSIYSYGRESRMAIETARKSVARILNAHPSEIFFTSGGTESNNTAIFASVRDLGCKRIITSPIEHHAVSHTIEHLQKSDLISLFHVKLTPNGHVDLQDLEELIAASEEKTLVSLMHANNEIGNMLDIEKVGAICKKYGAVFHSDTVQTVGHFKIDLQKLNVHFITGAGHKFHGPKGSGLLYINQNIKIHPLIYGGAQERNMRAGTENLYGIVGFAKALESAMDNFEKDSTYISNLKFYMKEKLQLNIPEVRFNGDPEGNSLYTVLSVAFPKNNKTEMLLFNLDIANICASGGSACSSGADQGSHVIAALGNSFDQVTVRFSFSKYNTKEEIDMVVEKLMTLMS